MHGVLGGTAAGGIWRKEPSRADRKELISRVLILWVDGWRFCWQSRAIERLIWQAGAGAFRERREAMEAV